MRAPIDPRVLPAAARGALVGAEDYRDASRRQWGASAGEWARAVQEPDSDASAAAAEWMLAAAELRSGESVLELACGAGRVGLEAAGRVGPEGRVVCSDFAPEMVEAVREHAGSLGLEQVEARVLDAEQLELEKDERFGVVLCRFGYMLMGDPLRALGQTAGALAPGGRAVLAVWGSAEGNPWLSTILESVITHFGAPRPEPGTPGPFALGDPQRLASLLDEAGLPDASVTEIAAEQHYGSAEAWWDRIRSVSGPLQAALDAISEADRDAIRERALAGAAPYVGSDGEVAFPASVLGALATHAGREAARS